MKYLHLQCSTLHHRVSETPSRRRSPLSFALAVASIWALSIIVVIPSTAHASQQAGGAVGVLSSINNPAKKSIQGMGQFFMEKIQDEKVGGLLSAGVYYGVTRSVIGSFGVKSKSITAKDQHLLENIESSRHAEFKSMGTNIERWAESMLSETNDAKTGWNSIQCNKALKQKYNRCGRTKQYVKWMKDSREHHANPQDTKNHPCMKLYAVIDAPFHLVCRYLSQEHRYREYNSLLIDQKDIEELTPDSKICWSQTKKLLFIQPRDFITYCFHRWRKDGTQVIVTQACDHPRMKQGGYRAYSLRGATYIRKDPNYPQDKTQLVMLAHCNCGDDIPEWAVRSAVKVLAPIKPFEIVHRIRVGVAKAQKELMMLHEDDEKKRRKRRQKEKAKQRSNRPAGMAQMGCACFWPKGGGIVEGD